MSAGDNLQNTTTSTSLEIDTSLPDYTDINSAQFTDLNTSAGVDKAQDALIDPLGVVFDPAIHASRDINGEMIPIRKKNGEFRKKRSRHADKLAQSAEPNSQSESVNTDIMHSKAVKAQADFLSSLWGLAHQGVFGQAGNDKDMLKPVSESWERLIIEEGMPTLPAKAQLVMAHGVYSFSVATKPECESKTRKIISAVKNWFSKKTRKSQVIEQSQ